MDFFKRNKKELTPLLILFAIAVFYFFMKTIQQYETIMTFMAAVITVLLFMISLSGILFAVYLTRFQVRMIRENHYKNEEFISYAAVKAVTMVISFVLIVMGYELLNAALPHLAGFVSEENVKYAVFIAVPDLAIAACAVVFTLIREMILNPIKNIIRNERNVKKNENTA